MKKPQTTLTLPTMKKYLCAMLLLIAGSQYAHAQVSVSGSVQSDMLIPQEDKAINAVKEENFQTNTYADVNLMSKYVDAGVRLEYLQHPLPGFEREFKDWGLPNVYVRGKYKWAELTLGTYYEQFGSGFVLRAYEERSLGVDNSLLGGKLVLRPVEGLTVKALAGRQRTYWDWEKTLVSGADVEVALSQWIRPMRESGTVLTLGGSIVNKHEDDEEIPVQLAGGSYRLNVPKNVMAFDVRASLNTGNFNLLAEYAQKGQDPEAVNQYIYRKGYVAMLSASYSKKGMSALLQAKRSDNMAFRSQRSRSSASTAAYINHLPAFTQDHTYALAALYPYATQADGEWAYQGELAYTFKKKTALGGKYGTNVKVNFSYVRDLDRNNRRPVDVEMGDLRGTDGYGSAFWKWGRRTLYQDLNVTISHKFSKDFKLNFMYMNQKYNPIIRQEVGDMIHSHIFIADGKYTFSPRTALRAEAQFLATKQDEGNWIYGLLELSLAPRWMFTVSDMYNCGETKVHYYQGLVTCNLGAHRLQAGFGRTRAGYNCAGGVCRYVPASKGFTLSYNYSF